MKNVLVKVCGMREADNIREVEALGVDWMGFIFWPKSSRYVSEMPSYLPTKCKRVGVFVDASIGDVMTIAEQYQLDIIQLHGQESPSYITQLTSHLKSLTSRYEGYVDYFLFDTKGKSVGGNGEKFDWSVLSEYHGETPYLLSGGIAPDDAKSLTSSPSHPLTSSLCIGIDLNSRFESAPGMKDINKLRTFSKELSI